MLLKRLCICSDSIPVGIDNAYRVRKNVEDGFELRDASCEVFTQFFAFGDVAAGEQHATAAVGVCEWDEVRFNEPPCAAMLEGHTNGDDWDTTGSNVDLLGQV